MRRLPGKMAQSPTFRHKWGNAVEGLRESSMKLSLLCRTLNVKPHELRGNRSGLLGGVNFH